jgi:outer membrane protein assembly factor BamA
MRRPLRPGRRTLLAIFLFAGSPPGVALAADAPRVRRIVIVNRDIFDVRRPAENKGLYRLINNLHVTTKEKIVRREMLLQEGDAYDARLRWESERALRQVLRLRNVRITPVPVGPGLVDLQVVVHETWSTEPTLSLSGVGSQLTGKVGLREKNVAGLGSEASVLYRKDPAGDSRSYSYSDPNLWGTHLRLSAQYEERENGLARALQVKRPFYSSITPWSASVKGVYDDDDPVLYAGGNEAGRLHRRQRDVSAGYARSFGSTTRRIRRAGLGYRRFEKEVTTDTTPRVTLLDRGYHMATATLHLEKVDFLTADHVKLYDREEDFNLGPSVELEAGRSGRWMSDSEDATFVEAKAFVGADRGVSRFGLATFTTKGRYEDGGWRDARSRLDCEFYDHFAARQTFAFHAQAEVLTRADPDSQILLGGDRGLRGYQLNQFAGDRLLLLNVENRFFVVDDLWRLFSVGTVVFADTGYVWPDGRPLDFGDLKTDIGAGLRFHISRSSFGNVLRLDVAYAVDRVPGESRVVITFGSSQAF